MQCKTAPFKDEITFELNTWKQHGNMVFWKYSYSQHIGLQIFCNDSFQECLGHENHS